MPIIAAQQPRWPPKDLRLGSLPEPPPPPQHSGGGLSLGSSGGFTRTLVGGSADASTVPAVTQRAPRSPCAPCSRCGTGPLPCPLGRSPGRRAAPRPLRRAYSPSSAHPGVVSQAAVEQLHQQRRMFDEEHLRVPCPPPPSRDKPCDLTGGLWRERSPPRAKPPATTERSPPTAPPAAGSPPLAASPPRAASPARPPLAHSRPPSPAPRAAGRARRCG